jgi:hypothetical protein
MSPFGTNTTLGGYPPVMKAKLISIGGWRSVAIYEYTP